MEPTFFAFLCLATAALVWLIARGEPVAKAAEKKPPSHESRWHRLALHPAALESGSSSATVVRQLPKGLVLRLEEGAVDDLPIVLVDGDDAPRVRLDQPLLPARRLAVRLDRKPWLRLRLDGEERFPTRESLDGRRPPNAPAAGSIELHGSLAEREYEVRVDGRLVASVSWQAAERGSLAPEGTYVVEVVRSAPLLPLVGLVVALEVAANHAGARALAPTR